MYFNPKTSALFSSQDSPSLYKLNSTDMQTPGIKSPSMFSNDKFLGSPIASSPEKKFGKSDMICISRAQLEHELHSFVAHLVQQKSVNENDTLYYLDQLKASVINLIRENNRLQSNPQSARDNMASPRDNKAPGQKDEELVQQRNFYEDKIKQNSLHISRLEHKINDLAGQCQGLMRINHELSGQMLQISQGGAAGNNQDIQAVFADNERLLEMNSKLEVMFGNLQSENQELKAIVEKGKAEIRTIQRERDLMKVELEKALKSVKEHQEQLTSMNEKEMEFKDVQRKESLKSLTRNDSALDTQNLTEEDTIKPQTEGNLRLKHLDLLKKQLGDYKSANAILHKKIEKYLLQIEDLNEALKLTNENLEALQNKYITLEKELVNKHKIEAIMNSHMGVIGKLEVKIQSITDENIVLQKVNQENMMVIAELHAQLEAVKATYDNEKGIQSPVFATPNKLNAGEFGQVDQSGRMNHTSGSKTAETAMLEQEFTKKKFEERMANALHEKELEIRAERIKHKNQIEKYNSNLQVLSKKIQALVTVNEGLGKDLEILKIEFSNYRTVSWSVIQEVRSCLDSFRKYDQEVSKGLLEIEGRNGRCLEKVKKAYEGLRKDILTADEVIEERRKYL